MMLLLNFNEPSLMVWVILLQIKYTLLCFSDDYLLTIKNVKQISGRKT